MAGMADDRVMIDTDEGPVELTVAQLLELKTRVEEMRDPVWHPNRCGCCVSVHERDDHSAGWVIGRDGGADWVETN